MTCYRQVVFVIAVVFSAAAVSTSEVGPRQFVFFSKLGQVANGHDHFTLKLTIDKKATRNLVSEMRRFLDTRIEQVRNSSPGGGIITCTT